MKRAAKKMEDPQHMRAPRTTSILAHLNSLGREHLRCPGATFPAMPRKPPA